MDRTVPEGFEAVATEALDVVVSLVTLYFVVLRLHRKFDFKKIYSDLEGETPEEREAEGAARLFNSAHERHLCDLAAYHLGNCCRLDPVKGFFMRLEVPEVGLAWQRVTDDTVYRHAQVSCVTW
jgi:hypothetical protein